MPDCMQYDSYCCLAVMVDKMPRFAPNLPHHRFFLLPIAFPTFIRLQWNQFSLELVQAGKTLGLRCCLKYTRVKIS